ncbi:MAG: NAD(+)/NADH kinase [Anaerolineae bacterium]|nr:NAD(+)/NADH kinase [Anaerolineae bacterium]
MRPNTVGVIVNPKAGQGAAQNLRAAARLAKALDAQTLLTGPGVLGADALPSARILPIPPLSGREASQALAAAALAAGVDALAVIGGDGTLSDVAFVIHESGARCPILGIGAGSINAGDLIACQSAQIDALREADFRVESVSALEAGCNDKALALAFNDVVIGTTIVGTVGTEFADLDANAFLKGQRILGEPRPIGIDSARVVKRRPSGDLPVASGRNVGTVIVGFAHYESFFGKAIIGGVCLSALMGAPAGCLVCEQALVRTHLAPGEYQSMEPLHSSYVSLGDDGLIEISGLDFPAVLCADGNPLVALHPADHAQIRVRRGAVDVLRIAGERSVP